MTKPDEVPHTSNDNVAGGRGYALVLQTLLAPMDQIRCAAEAEAFVSLLEQPKIAQMLPEPFDGHRREAIRKLKTRYWRPALVPHGAIQQPSFDGSQEVASVTSIDSARQEPK